MLPQDTSQNPPLLGRDEQCPLCHRDNHCRIAKGHLYKGPCWCHQIEIPGHLLTRLAEDELEPACFCRPCLETLAAVSQSLSEAEAVLAEVRLLRSGHEPFLKQVQPRPG